MEKIIKTYCEYDLTCLHNLSLILHQTNIVTVCYVRQETKNYLYMTV